MASFEMEAVVRNASAMGACSVYDSIANLNYEDFTTELDND